MAANRSPPTHLATRTRHTRRALLLCALLTGFALRLFRLGSESFWYDETVSVFLARLPIPQMIAHTMGDIHPPAYYFLLNLWQWLTSPTLLHGLEFLFAWPSLFFGLLIPALLFPIGRRLYNREPSGCVALGAVWIACLHPFQLWYSQEVRMYTLGALLGLLCLWAMLNLFQYGASADSPTEATNRPRLWLVLYLVAATTGLYTLYFFAFLILGLNVIALVFTVAVYNKSIYAQNIPKAGLKQRAVQWLFAQIAIVILWLPWLPTFWHQVTVPPVPVWRTNWHGISDIMYATVESMSALLLGQSQPAATQVIWAVIVLLFFIAHLYLSWTKHKSIPVAALFILIPVVLIVIISQTITPIYHVRYIFIYASPFALVMADVLVYMLRTKFRLGLTAVALLLAITLVGYWEYWTNPLYRPDDHRAAVSELANNWHPGDVILVNAGWAYTPIAVYWPDEYASPTDSLPPPLAEMQRLDTITATKNPVENTVPLRVPVIRTGSVDDSPTLGWGDPASDFFAISTEETLNALNRIGEHYPRIWHYRIYDTVSDPAGRIRTWLDGNTSLAFQRTYPGRDFLQVSLHQTNQKPQDAVNVLKPSRFTTFVDEARFGNALLLKTHATAATIPAGQRLYTTLSWSQDGEPLVSISGISASLRLVNKDGNIIAQSDRSLSEPDIHWQEDGTGSQPFALSIPVGAQPGEYQLELVVYEQENLQPLPITHSTPERIRDESRFVLNDTTILPPSPFDANPMP